MLGLGHQDLLLAIRFHQKEFQWRWVDLPCGLVQCQYSDRLLLLTLAKNENLLVCLLINRRPFNNQCTTAVCNLSLLFLGPAPAPTCRLIVARVKVICQFVPDWRFQCFDVLPRVYEVAETCQVRTIGCCFIWIVRIEWVEIVTETGSVQAQHVSLLLVLSVMLD
jgi:hypothetical protein